MDSKKPRLRLTFWVPTQYGTDLDPAELAAKLRTYGFPEAADTAEKIARGEITTGDATDQVGGEHPELHDLAYAIRKTDDGDFIVGQPLDTDDPETYHVYVGEPQ